MKEITREMTKDFELKKLGYDFCGYPFSKTQQLSFHHLVIPRRYSEMCGLGDGYYYWNGAILRQDTSHEYLHLIENKDINIFLAITSELIDENIKGRIDEANLRRMLDAFHDFEDKHMEDTRKKGNYLIKNEYLYRPALEEPVRRVRRR